MNERLRHQELVSLKKRPSAVDVSDEVVSNQPARLPGNASNSGT